MSMVKLGCFGLGMGMGFIPFALTFSVELSFSLMLALMD
jgi:hypothetical protein